MDSVNTQECVLLAWSAQDVELHDREGLVIIPVSPAGYVATRCGTKGRVVETNHYVDGYGEAYRVTLADLRCVETALIELRQPWMASYAGMEVHLFVSQVLMWDKLLSNICKTMSHSPVTIIPPSAFENPELLRPVSWDRREMNAFWACARALERKGLVGIWRSKPAGSGK